MATEIKLGKGIKLFWTILTLGLIYFAIFGLDGIILVDLGIILLAILMLEDFTILVHKKAPPKKLSIMDLKNQAYIKRR